MIRRYGSPPLLGTRYNARPGAYGVLLRNRRILLTFQDSPIPEWQLPGGGIDPGESAIQGLHRECLEETGWRISNPRKLGTYRRFVYMPEYEIFAEKICHIFIARPSQRQSEPREPGHSAAWFSPAEAITQLRNEGDRDMLQSALYLRGLLG